MRFVELSKQEPELRMVWGEVYAPNRPDVHGEYMTEEDIRLLAYRFLAKKMSGAGSVDVQHNNKVEQDLVIFESFIARPGDPDFIPGSWVLGVHINNDSLWADVKAGKLNGFSIEALVNKQEQEVTLEIPDAVTGITSVVNDHAHKFTVSFNERGLLAGGQTDVVNGHSHRIVTGTITEEVGGHRHKFSSVDNIGIVPNDPT